MTPSRPFTFALAPLALAAGYGFTGQAAAQTADTGAATPVAARTASSASGGGPLPAIVPQGHHRRSDAPGGIAIQYPLHAGIVTTMTDAGVATGSYTSSSPSPTRTRRR